MRKEVDSATTSVHTKLLSKVVNTEALSHNFSNFEAHHPLSKQDSKLAQRFEAEKNGRGSQHAVSLNGLCNSAMAAIELPSIALYNPKQVYQPRTDRIVSLEAFLMKSSPIAAEGKDLFEESGFDYDTFHPAVPVFPHRGDQIEDKNSPLFEMMLGKRKLSNGLGLPPTSYAEDDYVTSNYARSSNLKSAQKNPSKKNSVKIPAAAETGFDWVPLRLPNTEAPEFESFQTRMGILRDKYSKMSSHEIYYLGTRYVQNLALREKDYQAANQRITSYYENKKERLNRLLGDL